VCVGLAFQCTVTCVYALLQCPALCCSVLQCVAVCVGLPTTTAICLRYQCTVTRAYDCMYVKCVCVCVCMYAKRVRVLVYMHIWGGYGQ